MRRCGLERAGEGDGGEGGRSLGCRGEADTTLGNDKVAVRADRGEDWGDEGDAEKGAVRDRTSMRFVMDFPGEGKEWGVNWGRGAKTPERSFGLGGGVTATLLTGLVERLGVFGRVKMQAVVSIGAMSGDRVEKTVWHTCCDQRRIIAGL